MKNRQKITHTYTIRRQTPSGLDHIFSGAAAAVIAPPVFNGLLSETQSIVKQNHDYVPENFDATYVPFATTLLMTGVVLSLTYAFALKASSNLRGNFVEISSSKENGYVSEVAETKTPPIERVNGLTDEERIDRALESLKEPFPSLRTPSA